MKTALVIALTSCISSQLNGFGYDADSKTLAISFPGRGAQPDTIYHYFDVPAEVWSDFLAAESKGKFFGAEIKGMYRYEKQPDADGIAFGLPLAQEPKYTTGARDGRICNRATGKPIPDDEPVFILRAKDVHAAAALHAYLSAITAVTEPAHVIEVQRRIDAFDAFAAAHPDLVKQPDTAAA